MLTREELLTMRSTWPGDGKVEFAENNRPWLLTVLSHLEAMDEIDRLKEELKKINEAIARDMNYVDSIRKVMDERGVEIDRLNKWVADLQTGKFINCVYVCPTHPLAAVLKEIEALKEERTQLRRSVEDLVREKDYANDQWAKIQQSTGACEQIRKDQEIERLKAECADLKKRLRGWVENFDKGNIAWTLKGASDVASKALHPVEEDCPYCGHEDGPCVIHGASKPRRMKGRPGLVSPHNKEHDWIPECDEEGDDPWRRCEPCEALEEHDPPNITRENPYPEGVPPGRILPVTEEERIAVAEQFADPKNAADDPVIRAAIEKRVGHIAAVLRYIDELYGNWGCGTGTKTPIDGTMNCPACNGIVRFYRHGGDGRVNGQCSSAGCLNFTGAK